MALQFYYDRISTVRFFTGTCETFFLEVYCEPTQERAKTTKVKDRIDIIVHM